MAEVTVVLRHLLVFNVQLLLAPFFSVVNWIDTKGSLSFLVYIRSYHVRAKRTGLTQRSKLPRQEQTVFKNKKREFTAARLLFELKHSQEHILPDYEIAKTNASNEETKVKRAIENEQKRLNALHAQIAFADICSEDLRSVGKIQGNHPLAECQMVEAKTLLNFKLRKEVHGKTLEFREQLEDVELKPLYNAVDWMYGLGFHDHPAAQESGFQGRGVQKTSVTRKMLVNALSNVFSLQSSSAGLQTVPEE